jgi:hypothetical protein
LILVVEKCCLFFEIWTEFFKILFGWALAAKG